MQLVFIMKNLQLKSISFEDKEYIKTIRGIYNSSFPENERIDFDIIQQSLKDKETAFTLEGIIYNNQLAGLISYLREDKYLILCYFALDKQYRNQGIGTEVLSILADKYSNCTLIGEIEHPKDSLSKRRIGFYKRNNFYITDFGYKQPALIANTEPVPLLIISYPKELTKTEYQTIKDIFYKKIYRVE